MIDLRITEEEAKLLLGALTRDVERAEQDYNYNLWCKLSNLYHKVLDAKTR